MLERLGYRRQVNRKSLEGGHHVDRNAQFEHINAQVEAFQAAGQPVIPVDTKKKELIGPYKNGGSDYRPQGCPDEVNVHDFVDKELGKAIPYGVYDIGANAGCVSVGIDHDTAQFAVNAIRRWRATMGGERYPAAGRLMITADGGGSNGSRVRLWKVELQKFADETGLSVSVCHYPPGTSKWNKIEHRLACHITQNRRGRPLTSRSAVQAKGHIHGLSRRLDLAHAGAPHRRRRLVVHRLVRASRIVELDDIRPTNSANARSCILFLPGRDAWCGCARRGSGRAGTFSSARSVGVMATAGGTCRPGCSVAPFAVW